MCESKIQLQCLNLKFEKKNQTMQEDREARMVLDEQFNWWKRGTDKRDGNVVKISKAGI